MHSIADFAEGAEQVLCLVVFDCPLNTVIQEQHSFLFGHDQSSICLFLEDKTDQMPSDARYIHLCFHARMCNESHLAPHPGL